MLAAARSRLDTAPGSQSSSAARSTVLSGPADRRSGMPSRATLELIPLIPSSGNSQNCHEASHQPSRMNNPARLVFDAWAGRRLG
jgi:hypothetical protein